MERRRRLTSLRSVLLRYLCLCGGGCALILVLWWGIFMQLIDNGFLLSATASAQACAEARETVASMTADTFDPSAISFLCRYAVVCDANTDAERVTTTNMSARQLKTALNDLHGGSGNLGMMQYQYIVTMADGATCLLQYDYAVPYADPALRERLPDFQTCYIILLVVLMLAWLAATTHRTVRTFTAETSRIDEATRQIAAQHPEAVDVDHARIREFSATLQALQTLQAAGFRIIGPEAACQANFVLLPMSQERVSDAVARTLQGVRPGTLLLAGRPGSPIQAAARQASLPLLDYFQRPELECLNAVPTAEGCLALLLQLRRRTIWESDFLVLGYGRIGRAVARRLDLLGGHTTVAARNAVQRANARCAGHRAAPLDRLPVLLAKHDTVINTIPAPVLPRKMLEKLPRGALVTDLASLPGGTDFDAAEALGIRAEHALALPGKCAPDTAGALIAQTVLTILQERGDLHDEPA